MRAERYEWSGGSEVLLRFGEGSGPVLLAVLPLLEEANRTRTFTVRLLRRLAEAGLTCLLPDLPATGESLLPSQRFDPADCDEALEALVRGLGVPCYLFGLRSGCLLGGNAGSRGRYHFAPVTGRSLVRDLGRTRQAEAGMRGGLSERWFEDTSWHESPGLVRVAGNLLSARALAALDLLEPPAAGDLPRRIARLATDAATADVHLDGKPLWRTKEPRDDSDLAAALAADIARWMATCEG